MFSVYAEYTKVQNLWTCAFFRKEEMFGSLFLFRAQVLHFGYIGLYIAYLVLIEYATVIAFMHTKLKFVQ